MRQATEQHPNGLINESMSIIDEFRKLITFLYFIYLVHFLLSDNMTKFPWITPHFHLRIIPLKKKIRLDLDCISLTCIFPIYVSNKLWISKQFIQKGVRVGKARPCFHVEIQNHKLVYQFTYIGLIHQSFIFRRDWC